MKPGKLLLFALSALLFAAVSAFAGGLIAEAAGFDGHAGLMLGGLLSLAGTTVKAFAPGLFASHSFVMFASFADLGKTNQLSRAPIFSQERALYEYITQHNLEAGFDNILPLKGYLRSEVVLGVQNTIDFSIKEGELAPGQALISPDENRLRLNDAFYATHYSVMFRIWDTADATTRVLAPLQTFANANVFAGVAAAIEGAYNGALSLRVNDTVYVDSMDMNSFKYVDMAQQQQAISTVAGAGIQSSSAWNQDKAFREMTSPLVRLNGLFRNQFRVTLPANLNFTAEAGQTVGAVLYVRGWLMQNGGSTRTKRGGV